MPDKGLEKEDNFRTNDIEMHVTLQGCIFLRRLVSRETAGETLWGSLYFFDAHPHGSWRQVPGNMGKHCHPSVLEAS